MNWENLTSKEFAQAVKETGVCIVAFGVIERHGDHLPLGTDFLNGHKLATLAAQKESAVVFRRSILAKFTKHAVFRAP